jgi:hypothetical protein
LGKKKKADKNINQSPLSVSAQGDKGPYIPALSMADASKRYDVNTTAEKVRRRDFLIRLVAIILLALLIILGIGYCSMEILNKAGRFTVSLTPNEYGISLSDNPDFENPTLNLYADPIEEMDNITKKWIQNLNGELGDDPVYEDFNDIDKIWGQHNGKNYIAYTFGVKNASAGEDDVVSYRVTLDTNYAYKGADEAVRVAVFKNGVPTIYAKPKKGTPDGLEDFEADKNFVSDDIVMDEIRSDFKVGEMDRYTVVIWLEGEDPECVNDIMGGEAKFSMNFTVIGGKSSDNAG